MVKKHNFIRLDLRITNKTPKLFDALMSSGPYYAGRNLVRLAEIGLAVEEGRMQPPSAEGNRSEIIFSKPAPVHKESRKAQANEPAIKPHYKVAVGSPAAEAMANMFPDD